MGQPLLQNMRAADPGVVPDLLSCLGVDSILGDEVHLRCWQDARETSLERVKIMRTPSDKQVPRSRLMKHRDLTASFHRRSSYRLRNCLLNIHIFDDMRVDEPQDTGQPLV